MPFEMQTKTMEFHMFKHILVVYLWAGIALLE